MIGAFPIGSVSTAGIRTVNVLIAKKGTYTLTGKTIALGGIDDITKVPTLIVNREMVTPANIEIIVTNFGDFDVRLLRKKEGEASFTELTVMTTDTYDDTVGESDNVRYSAREIYGAYGGVKSQPIPTPGKNRTL